MIKTGTHQVLASLQQVSHLCCIDGVEKTGNEITLPKVCWNFYFAIVSKLESIIKFIKMFY